MKLNDNTLVVELDFSIRALNALKHLGVSTLIQLLELDINSHAHTTVGKGFMLSGIRISTRVVDEIKSAKGRYNIYALAE